MIEMIWAQGPNGELGVDNKLPWKVREDLVHFKKTTLDAVLIMGRTTYSTLPTVVLDRAQCIVLSTHHGLPVPPGVTLVPTVSEALAMAKGKRCVVIGGLQTYTAFMPHASKLIVTNLDVKVDRADTFAPGVPDDFILIGSDKLSKRAEVYYYERAYSAR